MNMLDQYNHDMDTTIEIVRREFGPTAMYARKAALKMRDALGLPTVLLDIVNGYMDEFISDDVWGIIIACTKDTKKYKILPYVVLMTVATDNLELYLELLVHSGLWALSWGTEWERSHSKHNLPRFSDFALPTISAGGISRSCGFSLIQVIANILYWLGRGGPESKWITGSAGIDIDLKVCASYANLKKIYDRHARLK